MARPDRKQKLDSLMNSLERSDDWLDDLEPEEEDPGIGKFTQHHDPDAAWLEDYRLDIVSVGTSRYVCLSCGAEYTGKSRDLQRRRMQAHVIRECKESVVRRYEVPEQCPF